MKDTMTAGLVMFGLSTVFAAQEVNPLPQAIESYFRSLTNTPLGLASPAMFPSNAVPYLLPYMTNHAVNVRRAATRAVASVMVTNAVPYMADRLEDEDELVRIAAIGILMQMDPSVLRRYSPALDSKLAAFAKKVQRESEGAIHLLGQLAAPPELDADLKEINQNALDHLRARRGVMTASNVTIAVVEARAKFGHAEAIATIRGWLRADDVKTRLQGLDAVRYVGRSMVKDLAPLLDDTQMARNVGAHDASPLFLRVCDVAAWAIHDLLTPKSPLAFDDQTVTIARQSLAQFSP